MEAAQVLWWHWVVLGVVLTLLELAVPAFFLVWFGAGAIIVGLVMLAAPQLPFAWQVVAWIVASILFIALWFKVFKPGLHKTRSGMSAGAALGEVGLVVRDVRPFEKGQVRFQKPVLGDDLWEVTADEELKVGDRARVLAIEGNILKVGRA